VVRGYVAAGVAPPGSVHVRAPVDVDLSGFAELADHRELFDLRVDSDPGWEVSYYRSLAETDGLLLIGGGRSTLVTGLVALTYGLPLVAVATFGGNAGRVWEALDRAAGPADEAAVSEMALPWHDGSAAALVGGLLRRRQARADEAAAARRAERRRSRRTTVGLLVAALPLVAAIAALPAGYAWGPGTAGNVALLTAAPLAAAAAGALVRETLDEGAAQVRSAVLGLAAGAVSALLFLAAQLVATPDALDGAGGRRLLFFVVPVGFVAGLTFDAVHARLRRTDSPTTALPGP
jgi:hypothetical protein